MNTFIPLTLGVCIYRSLTSSAGQTAWHLPDKHHTPMYLESAAGGTDDPNPTSTEPYYMYNNFQLSRGIARIFGAGASNQNGNPYQK